MRRALRPPSAPSVVVDLRDAEVARLEPLLNEALDPLFVPKFRLRSTCSIAASVAATRRGCGSMPSPMSLWGATSACIGACHDTRIGRRVLAESHAIQDIVKAVTGYVARRPAVERERALDEDPEFITRVAKPEAARTLRRRRRGRWGTFVLGVVLGAIALLLGTLLVASYM